MVKRGRAARRDAGAGSPETMFESSRRMRSLWDGVRLEVAGESGGRPVVLHSFTQLDPDLPPLEVRLGLRGAWQRAAGRLCWAPGGERAPLGLGRAQSGGTLWFRPGW